MADEDLQAVRRRDAFRSGEHDAVGSKVREVCEEETEEEKGLSVPERPENPGTPSKTRALEGT